MNVKQPAEQTMATKAGHLGTTRPARRAPYGSRRSRMEDAIARPQGWLISFGDTITLLLALFVLLLSMSSLDNSLLESISVSLSPEAGSDSKEAQARERARKVLALLQTEDYLEGREATLKNLLFPEDVLPVKVDKGTLQDNFDIVQREEGIALILTDKLVFGKNSDRLPEQGRQILLGLAPLLVESRADIVISGHSLAGEEGSAALKKGTLDSYALSLNRALAVLRLYLEHGLSAHRFSVAGYGADRPIFEASSPQGQAKNKRVEILLKTSPSF